MGRCIAWSVALWLPVWWLDLRAAYPLEVFLQSPVLRAGAVAALGVMGVLAAGLGATGAAAARRGARAALVATLASVGLLALREPTQALLAPRLPGLALEGGLLLGAACAAGAALGLAAARLLPPDRRPGGQALLGIAALAAFALLLDAHFRVEPELRRPLLATHWAAMSLLWLCGPGVRISRPRLAAAAALAAVAAPASLALFVANPPAPRMQPTRGPERPDVVLVLIDTLRADHAALAPGGPPSMPALRALARDHATDFDRAYAPAPATRPSVRALFSAERPSRWRTSGPPLPEAWNLARAFRESGYRTAAFSASAVIDGPGFQAGFDEFWSASGRPFVQRSLLIRGLLCGRRRFCEFELAGRLGLHKEDGAFIRRLFGAWLGSAPRPAFAYLHLYDPHWPYRDHGFGFRDAEQQALADPHRYWDLFELEKGDPANAALRGTPRAGELVGRYVEEVRHSDAVLGGILDDLRAAGRYDGSLVLVVGDHGEEFFEHLGFGHGHDVYDEQLRVPLVLKWPRAPGFERMPERFEAPVSLIDVFPTLTEALALKRPPSPWQGRSLLPALRGEPGAGPSPVLSSIHWRGQVVSAYREGRLKVRLVHAASASPLSAEVEVFDVEADPAESRPLPISPELAALVERARREAHEDWRVAHRSPRPAPPASDSDPLHEQLRALGYLDE